MKIFLKALQVEILKTTRSSIVRASFIAFGLAPVMGALFILMIQYPENFTQAGGLYNKAKTMNFENNWTSYMGILSQAVGVGGILIFGFVASWIFGREYSDSTAKDLLSLPTSRTTIIKAKFALYTFWCLSLAISNMCLAFILGFLLDLPAVEFQAVLLQLSKYAMTTLLTVLVGTPIAFFAIYGKGYLVPLAFVALTLVFAQVIAAAGYGNYFPWSIPGLYSGTGGDYKDNLGQVSYFILLLTGISGYLATVFYLKCADHTR